MWLMNHVMSMNAHACGSILLSYNLVHHAQLVHSALAHKHVKAQCLDLTLPEH